MANVSEVKVSYWDENQFEPVMSDFINRMFTSVRATDDEVIFENDSEIFTLYHYQDCCETVSIDDICGDLFDLENTPILVAEELSSDLGPKSEYTDSYTWTFYEFRTIKGTVQIRFYGESNGYYSESVSLKYEKKV